MTEHIIQEQETGHPTEQEFSVSAADAPEVDDDRIMKAIKSDTRVARFICDVVDDKDISDSARRLFSIEAIPDQKEIREAERRGYIKGRNEAISMKMNEPAVYQTAAPATPASTPVILSNRRPGFWDKF